MEILTRSQARNYSQVRLVGDGTSEVVATSEAQRQAEQAGLDLILVSNKGEIPVVKISDLKKLEYQKKKEQVKTQHAELKEIQLKPNITDHDLETKVNAIKRFLERGDKVKVVVRLKGRQHEHADLAHMLLDKVVAQVPCKVSRAPGYTLMLEPVK